MQVHLVRHLPTEYNKNGILQGSMDIPLTFVSKEDEVRIVENRTVISNLELDEIYCSELMRAQETALLHGVNNFMIDARINELNFGTYEGKAKADMPQKVHELWKTNPEKLSLGESLIEFFERIDDFLFEKKSSNILCFTHGAVMRYVQAKYVLGNRNLMNTINIKNTELVSIEISNI